MTRTIVIRTGLQRGDRWPSWTLRKRGRPDGNEKLVVRTEGLGKEYPGGSIAVHALAQRLAASWPGEMVAIIGAFRLGKDDAAEHAGLRGPALAGTLLAGWGRHQPHGGQAALAGAQ